MKCSLMCALMQTGLPIKLWWPKEIGTKRDISAVQLEIQI